MKDLLTKLRILKNMLGSAFEEWREYIWAHDLDTHYCCPGDPRECGCMGATYRDIYAAPRRAQGKSAEGGK